MGNYAMCINNMKQRNSKCLLQEQRRGRKESFNFVKMIS